MNYVEEFVALNTYSTKKSPKLITLTLRNLGKKNQQLKLKVGKRN